MQLPFTRRQRLIVLGLLALLALYCAVGFWLVPRVARTQILTFAQAHWQREPTLGEISFNPFTLSLEVRDFAFQDSRHEPLLAFERLMVNLDIASLWRRGASFHAIELDRPSANVRVRADGSLNLSELSAPFAQPPGASPAPGQPARLFIDRLQLRAGALEFEDRARRSPFKARLTPVDFELLDFSTVAGSGNEYALQARSTAGEEFRWNGNFGLAPLRSQGRFALAAVQARTLWSYLQDSVGFEVSDGRVAVDGGYQFAASEAAPSLLVSLATVEIADLKLRPRGGDTDWISLAKLAVNDVRADLTRRTVDLARVTLTDGNVIAQRGADGAVNLLRLLEMPAAAVPETPPEIPPALSPTVAAPADSPWTVAVKEFDAESLRVEATDQFVQPAAAFTLAPINLRLRGFSTAPGQALEVTGDAALESGGTFRLQGRGTVSERAFDGQVQLDGLNLAALQPYVGTYTQMTLLSGMLNTRVDVQFTPHALRLAGSLECTRLHAIDNGLREDLVKWDRLGLEGVRYQAIDGRPAVLRIASISARAPYLRLIIAPDQTTNIGKVLTRPASAPGPVQTVRGTGQPTGIQQAMDIAIGRVQVANGSANFADFWITPNYAVSLQQLGGSISGLSSRKDSRAEVALTGKIDRYAPVQIGGSLNLLSASLFTDLHVKFDGVELTSVTPYSGRFAGYRIEKGKLSVDVRYRVENRRLDAEQRFVIDQLTLGERVESPDAVKLPLRLAVALLKDRNGVIDLGLPVTGSLDDPKFRLGPIIWKAFVNLLAGIATSPFKLIGSMFGGGEEVNLIDFEAGEAALDAPAREKLLALTKALRERPQLALDVPSTFAPDADYAALAARDLEARLAALAQARRPPAAASDPGTRFELLLALYSKEQPGAALPPGARALREVRAADREPGLVSGASQELQTALRPGIDSLDVALQSLAQQRARAIQDALLSSGEVEPGRVFLLAPAASPAVAGKARITLSLK